MQTIGAFAAKTHFSSLLDQVEKGEQVVITKHGRPVAKLIAVTTQNQLSLKNTIQRLKEFGKGQTLGGINWKDLRDEGRRF